MNAKNFRSMHIMHELPTNKANFLIKTTQDFNSSRHAAPHLPIVFTDNIILYFNWIPFVLHVFKRSRNAHITFIFGQGMLITVYAYRTSEIFLQKKNLGLSFQHKKPFQGWITTLVINARLFTTLQNVYMFKIIEVESASKFSLRVIWKMVLFMVRDFQNSIKYQAFRNVSIYFLLSYHNNVMLKTDIMLDYW